MLGASFDAPAENKEFAEAQSFNFKLLSDVDRSVGAQYEVTRPADDKLAALPLRIAYLVDPDGTIRRSYEVADVNGFAGLVVDDLRRVRS